jgi:hypothetical protein
LTPDIPPDDRWGIPVKNLILAAFATLSFGAGVARIAQAALLGSAQTSVHQGHYDNTANSLGGRFVGRWHKGRGYSSAFFLLGGRHWLQGGPLVTVGDYAASSVVCS